MRTSYVGRLTGILTATLILFAVCLSGCGTTTVISNPSSTSAELSLSSLVFVASITPGSAQTVTLSNTGNTALNISQLRLTGFRTDGKGCGHRGK